MISTHEKRPRKKRRERKGKMNRTFLKGLGLEQEAIDSIMAEYGRNVTELNDKIDTLNKKNEDTQKLLNTANESLKSFEGVDIEALKNASETLKNEYERKIRDMQVRGAIEKALVDAKAKHTDLLIDKFDKEKIKIDKNGTITGIDEQLNGFKESYKDLFTVDVQGQNPNHPDNGGSGETFNFGFTGVRGTQE